jgi:putative acetyltransferase
MAAADPPAAGISIVEVRDGDDLRQAGRLLAEYFAWLADDLAALGIDVAGAHRLEVASLPGEYAPPGGRLLLARRGGEPAGCVALRRLEPAICELRRLYIRPPWRGAGLGRSLLLAALAAARDMAYERVRLNTLPSMAQARALYGDLGFREVPPYRAASIPGLTFLELTLANPPPIPGAG